MKVSLVVPCYQEEEALGAFGALLDRLEVDEVVFVDDGSTDRTPGVLEALAAGDRRVRIETHPQRRGVGAAMRTGLGAAGGDVVVVYDADRTYPPEDISRLVREVGAGADVATASPWMSGGRGPDVPWFRRVLSQGAAVAYRFVLGPRAGGVATFTCAFRAYRRSRVGRLVFASNGFGAAAEILGLAILAGDRVVEVPSRLGVRQEGRSQMRVGPAMAEHLGVLARLWRRRSAAPWKGMTRR